LRIDVDEDFFDRGNVRLRIANHRYQRSQNRPKPLMQIAGRHTNDTGGNERKPGAVHLDDAIPCPIQTGIDTEDADCGERHGRIVPLTKTIAARKRLAQYKQFGTRNGHTPFITSSMLVLVTPATTFSTTPTGGVINPIELLITNKTPK
jgi:hypothetical protein